MDLINLDFSSDVDCELISCVEHRSRPEHAVMRFLFFAVRDLYRCLQNFRWKCQPWLALAIVLLSIGKASAHYCGPPIIRCKPGDIITYYIISDMAEFGDSQYSILNESKPSVAPLVFYTPTARIAGVFVFQAQQVGTNDLEIKWYFPPNGNFNVCLPRIIVKENKMASAANYPWSATDGDPVNMFTGELVMTAPPDLNLGGPMPLMFGRYYASKLQADATVNTRMGNNWSHNFDWRAVLVVTNKAMIVSPQGLQVKFNKSGTNWVLESSTSMPFQLANSGTNVVFGDPRNNRLYTFATNSGVLTAISDGVGNTHTLTYTNDFLLTQVSDGLGRTLSFTYTGPRFLTTVSDGTRTIGFQQAEIGDDFNLLRVTNAIGKVTRYDYDNSKEIGSLLTATVYPMGNTNYAQVYDAEGRVIRQTHLDTNTTSFFYDPNTLSTYVTNAQGNVRVFVHSPNGIVTSLTDQVGQTISLGTNSAGRRISVADRTSGTTRISYDPASGEASAVTNADNTVTRFTYTNHVVSGITFYQLSSVTKPDGGVLQFNYDATGRLLKQTDEAGKITAMAYNSRGQITTITNPLGAIVTNIYNADGTLATNRNADSGSIVLSYDSLRRATNATASDGRSTRCAFDAVDRLISFRNERTNTTFFSYDDNNRLVAVTNALGKVTRFNFDSGNRLTNVLDRLGRPTDFVYDSLDQTVGITNRNGNRTSFGWDTRQRLTSLTDPGNKIWSYGYDNESLPTSFTDPLGNSSRQAFDAAGFVSSFTNAAGNATSIGRDGVHRVTSTTDPLSRHNFFKYDPRGLLTNTTFSAVGIASYEMNDLGLLKKLTDQNGSAWQFNYNKLGRLTNIVDPLNRTNSFTHDSRGRPLRAAFSGGTAQTNIYDAAGNISQINFSGALNFTFGCDALNRVTNATGLLFGYDAENRVTNTVSSGINFAASYDAGGRLTNAAYSNGLFSVAYVYDTRNRLTQVRDSLTSAQMDFYYDDAGRLTNVVRANGVNGIYNYDAANRMTRIREGAFLDLQFALNADGEIAWLDSAAPFSPAPTGSTNQFSFNAAHQINSAGYTYDNRGRLTASPGHTFVWNAASHLTRLDSVTNTYNGAGNLLTRAVASGTTRFHYNHAIAAAPVMAEQKVSTGQMQRYYVWSPSGQLLYMIDAANGNAVYYFHFDRTGSTRALTSTAGTVTDAYAYSPYGVLAARIGTNTQPFTYVGRYGVRMETNASLYQMRARFYDPASARFISRDPLWPRLTAPLSLNPYVYAANNPLIYVDPAGTLDTETSQVQVQAKISEVSHGGGLINLGYALSQLHWGDWPPPPEPKISPAPQKSENSSVITPPQIDLVADLSEPTQPPRAIKPTPVNPVALSLLNLMPEMMVVNWYGAWLNVFQNRGVLGRAGLGSFSPFSPAAIQWSGIAFVNGEMVKPKIGDFIQESKWYYYYWDEDYWDWYNWYYSDDEGYCHCPDCCEYCANEHWDDEEYWYVYDYHPHKTIKNLLIAPLLQGGSGGLMQRSQFVAPRMTF